MCFPEPLIQASSQSQMDGSNATTATSSSVYTSYTIDDFELLQVLGKGAFGSVVLVKKKDDLEICALKVIKKASLTDRDVQNTIAEKEIMRVQKHPFLARLK